MQTLDISAFLKKHQLPERYAKEVESWFLPIIQDIVKQQKVANRPIIVGINGTQGSGKSTLADLLVFFFQQQYQLNAIALSIDDFYLTHQQRQALAQTIHPLMATRGVPGTHDVSLANETLRQLIGNEGNVLIPRFNKAIDDRYPQSEWDEVTAPMDVIVLEGWCLGAEAQVESDLLLAVNDLESNEDAHGVWRNYVNQQLLNEYPSVFQQVDSWIMLQAPSFECVFKWRLEQEHKLRDKLCKQGQLTDNKVMDDVAVGRFIKFYQRITECLLKTLPAKVDYLLTLDENRVIQQFSRPTINN